MDHLPTAFRNTILAAACAAWTAELAGPAGCPVVLTEDESAESSCETRLEMERAIATLSRGTPEEKREVAENVATLFLGIGRGGCDPVGLRSQQLAEFLETLLDVEEDDWILDRILQGLAPIGDSRLAPLFRAALRNRSPNLRNRAFEWLETVDDPESLPGLQAAWASERRPWVRSSILTALGRQGSTAHLREFFEIARADEDPRMTRSAIAALSATEDSSVIPMLSDLALHGRPSIRAKALFGLAFRHTPRALETLLLVSRDPEPALRAQAIDLLGEIPDAAAGKRLLETLTTPEDVLALDAAVHALARRGEPSLPPLPSLLSSLPPDASDSFDAVRQVLQEDGTEEIVLSFQCNLRIGFLDETDLGWVSPPAGLASVRCWSAPAIAGSPDELSRISGGTTLRIEDRFERDGELWLRGWADGEDCWMPASQVDDRPMEDDASAQMEDRASNEFDLDASELRIPDAGVLLDSALLEVIEPGDPVLGVSLRSEGLTPEDVRILRGCRFPPETVLEDQVLSLLQELPAAAGPSE